MALFTHHDKKTAARETPSAFPVWRTVAVGLVVVVAFNIFWLVPALRDMEDRVLAHLLETAEKIEIEAKEIVISHPKNQIDELALFVLQKLRGNVTLDTFDAGEITAFLQDRNEVVEVFIIDASGMEKARVSHGRVFAPHELRNVAGSDYFIEALNGGFTARAYHLPQKGIPNILAYERVDVPDLGTFVFGVNVDIRDRLEGFSQKIMEEEGERVYIADDTGAIIDHYAPERVGNSLLQLDFVKKVFDERGGEKYTYQSGAYTDRSGEKMQAVALLFEPINFVIVAEEEYGEVWQTWNKFLFFAIAGLILFVLLALVLTRSTLRAVDFSNQLIREKGRTESVIANLETGIIEYSPDFLVTLMNPKAEQILGVTKEDALGAIIHPNIIHKNPALTSLAQVLYPILAENVRKVRLQKGMPDIIEMRLSRPSEIELQISTIPIRDEKNSVVRYLKVLRDVSREQAIAKSKSEFISVAAHQLRTPLSAIKWVMKLMLDQDAGPITPEQKDLLTKGYESNERMIELVTDMLDVARIEEGKFGFSFQHTNLIALVQKAMDAFVVKAKEKNIMLVFEKPETAYSLKIDAARIELVLQNFIDNALKYTPNDGTITVSITATGRYVKISIRDTGIGVPKEQAVRLFTKFFRGTNAVKRQTEGSGLGLFLAKNIVMRHGGNVSVETEEGKGSAFSFTLPLDEDKIPGEEGKNEEFVNGLST
ncbi:PAS domain-containing protein [Candidatus Azambacteria bacterium]|nr:PAS domain-containing protein [Candidatus Azambacteria bacterium]